MLDASLSTEGLLWVELRGALDASARELLYDCTKEALSHRGLVLDLRLVSSEDPEGLALVDEVGARLAAAGRRCLVVGGPAAAVAAARG